MSFEEQFDKLKEIVENAPNKKRIFSAQVSFGDDYFEINSALYDDTIRIYDVTEIKQIYDSVKEEDIDSDLFNNPYYIIVSLYVVNEQTIDVINQLDDNSFVEIRYRKDTLDENDLEKLLKIKNSKSCIIISQLVNLEYLYELSKKITISKDSAPVVIVDKIDEDTVNKMKCIHNKIDKATFKIRVKDRDSMHNLYGHISELPNAEIRIELDNNFFNSDNPENTRALNFEDDGVMNFERENVEFVYQNISYNSIGKIIELMRYIEVIKSYVSSDTLEIDITAQTNAIHDKFAEKEFKIRVKDSDSLRSLYRNISKFSDRGLVIELDDNLFNRDNPCNARDLIIEEDSNFNFESENVYVIYQNMTYNSIGQVFELERNIELIRSHIPSDALEIDIITYVSLFAINYFKYDYSMLKKKWNNRPDITIAEFISRGAGVCRHFAKFTKFFLNSLGVWCEEVEGVGHTFNVVKIDGKMHFLDVTWLVVGIQKGVVKSLAESSDYLRSNDNFGHKEYENTLSQYECEDYDRNEINESVKRVTGWRKNYSIQRGALQDLLRKYIIKNKGSLEDRIAAAIPRR